MKKNKNPELIKERNDKIKQFLIDMIAPAIFLIFIVVILIIINNSAKEKDVDDMPEVIPLGLRGFQNRLKIGLLRQRSYRIGISDDLLVAAVITYQIVITPAFQILDL